MRSCSGQAKANDKTDSRIGSQPDGPAQIALQSVLTGESAISGEHGNHFDAEARQDIAVRDVLVLFLHMHLSIRSVTSLALQSNRTKQKADGAQRWHSIKSASREAGESQRATAQERCSRVPPPH